MIKVRDIKKSYMAGLHRVEALRGVSLDIKAGEMLAIMGPSGSGKTTLMNILGCLDRPTEGTYMFEGFDIGTQGEEELAGLRNRKIGFVFQTFNLLARQSALENVELPLLYSGMSDTKDMALAALREVGLEDRARHRPGELSGGERQRVAIARAIVLGPSLILADEPTGNLDTATGEEIMEVFKWLNSKGSTLVVVTHEKEVADKCRRIVGIRDGLVIKDTALQQEGRA